MTKPLIATNPYLADPVKRRAMFVLTVISSSAIEDVRLTADDLETRGDEAMAASRPHKPKIARFESWPRNHPHPGGDLR